VWDLPEDSWLMKRKASRTWQVIMGMVSEAERGSLDEPNYEGEAARARGWAAQARIVEVREQLLRVARMYEHLAEFSDRCTSRLLSKLEDLKPPVG
jgi:hypothetical protein